MPSYVIPREIMAVNQEQVSQCTIGTNSIIMGITNHKASLVNQQDVKVVEVDNPIQLVQNLVAYPAAVERYLQKDETDNFVREDPSLVDFRALKPTSARKEWKLRHHKRINKPLKQEKRGGYTGNS